MRSGGCARTPTCSARERPGSVTRVRIVLVGDSHLARVRRDLPVLGPDVRNAAVGGASVRHLPGQAASAGLTAGDVVVVSVGTNDAAPWKQVPLTSFVGALDDFTRSVPCRRIVYVAPPGVDEARLTGTHDRTNAVIDAYRDAALAVLRDVAAQVVRADRLLEPLGARAFVDDGLHLSGAGYRVVLPAIAELARPTA